MASRTSRREFLARWGKAAAALPVIATLAIPTPARAASCVPSGGACGSAADCCPGASAQICATIGVTAFRCCTGLAQACNSGDLCCGSNPGASSALETVCCPGGTVNAGRCGRLTGGCCTMGAVNVACCSNSCLGPADAVNCGIATGTCS